MGNSHKEAAFLQPRSGYCDKQSLRERHVPELWMRLQSHKKCSRAYVSLLLHYTSPPILNKSQFLQVFSADVSVLCCSLKVMLSLCRATQSRGLEKGTQAPRNMETRLLFKALRDQKVHHPLVHRLGLAIGGPPGYGDRKPDGLQSTGSQSQTWLKQLGTHLLEGSRHEWPKGSSFAGTSFRAPSGPWQSCLGKWVHSGSRDDSQDRRKIGRQFKNLILNLYYNILHLWYNIVNGLHKEYTDSFICRYILLLQIIFPYVLLLCWVGFPVLYRKSLLIICFIHLSVYMLIQTS